VKTATPATSCYIDTSALAKWYVPEAGSAEFDEFIRAVPDAVSGRLTVVELRCLVARRRRNGTLGPDAERRAYALFLEHVAHGIVRIEPLPDRRHAEAAALIERLPAAVALRSLDALHLAAALAAEAPQLATADRAMAAAGEALGLEVAFFGGRR
jgi:uncharacterized protein